jgi:hypothetical protein
MTSYTHKHNQIHVVVVSSCCYYHQLLRNDFELEQQHQLMECVTVLRDMMYKNNSHLVWINRLMETHSKVDERNLITIDW